MTTSFPESSSPIPPPAVHGVYRDGVIVGPADFTDLLDALQDDDEE